MPSDHDLAEAVKSKPFMLLYNRNGSYHRRHAGTEAEAVVIFDEMTKQHGAGVLAYNLHKTGYNPIQLRRPSPPKLVSNA